MKSAMPYVNNQDAAMHYEDGGAGASRPSENPAPTPDVDGDSEVVGAQAFLGLGLSDSLVQCVDELGYETATPIQLQAIPQMIAGHDLLCQAATGTGKTAAFALPILQQLSDTEAEGAAHGARPRAIVLTPTRELCMQVAAAFRRYGQRQDVRVVAVFGGQPIGRQVSELKRGVDVVVATPGRAIDLIERRYLKLDNVATVVLDEADEMLDMGFAEDIESILTSAGSRQQTVMFSATMPKRITHIANKHLTNPRNISIPRDKLEEGQRPTIKQTAYVVARKHKAAALGRILDVELPSATIVFCRTRVDVDELTEALTARGYRAEAIHGGLDQQQRDRVMNRLRSRTSELLVATDVAARGLDVEHLTHVVNFDVPAAPESYVHRIGRVGRGGRTGVAITMVDPREQRQLRAIERSTGQDIAIVELPSVDDVRQQRLAKTREAIALLATDPDLSDYRSVLDELERQFGRDAATLAAVKLAHVATVGDVRDVYIPTSTLDSTSKKGATGRDGAGKRRGRGRDEERDGTESPKRGFNKRESSGRRHHEEDRVAPRSVRQARRSDGDSPKGARRSPSTGGSPSVGKKRIMIALGTEAGVRPKDIVGAIANETALSGRDVGAIDITPRHSTVEVPARAAKDVIAALERTRIQGRKVKARLDRH